MRSPKEHLCYAAARWRWVCAVERVGANNTRTAGPAIRASDVSKLALKWAFDFRAARGGSPRCRRPAVRREFGGPKSIRWMKKRAARIGPSMLAGTTYGDFHGEFAPVAKRRRPEIYSGPRRKHGGSKKSKRQYTLAHLDILKAASAAFFGDDTGAVYALDAQRGTLL